MHANLRTVALLVFALPACAMAQTLHEASRIGGSIYPTVIQPAPLSAPMPAIHAHAFAATQRVDALCLASHAHADRCTPTGMAVCDVESIGFSRCLAHYARALVKQPVAATRTVNVMLRDAHGALCTVTVLATRAQSDEAIAEAALEGMPRATVVAMRMTSVDATYAATPHNPQLTADPPNAPTAGQTAAPLSP